ncbi:hypothetical protein MLD38_009188 [Melastoma candidum]|uniref:Uncharacterized protein n=1 Tax=Melastoma candidum TaxID=119954 RepID=A0ACB9RWE9_9MYRT|nr:hypothetical protein MLD38_009188 [Melastoma candidum]
MIELRSTWPGEYSARVELEIEVSGIYSNRDRLVGRGLQQGCLTVGRDILVSGYVYCRIGFLLYVAFPVDSLVRVTRLSGQAMTLDELESAVHPTSLAPLVDSMNVAVDELLLRKRDQLPCGDLVDAFHSCHRRESPAASCKVLNPVNKRSATIG